MDVREHFTPCPAGAGTQQVVVRALPGVMVDRRGTVPQGGGRRPSQVLPGRGSGKALVRLLAGRHPHFLVGAPLCLSGTHCSALAHTGCRWHLGTPRWWAVPLRAGPPASPCAGSQPPPPGRRGWSAAAAGPPAAAGTSLGRTCTRSAPSALGPGEKIRALSQPAQPCSAHTSTPRPGCLSSLGLPFGLYGVLMWTSLSRNPLPHRPRPLCLLGCSPISVREV